MRRTAAAFFLLCTLLAGCTGSPKADGSSAPAVSSSAQGAQSGPARIVGELCGLFTADTLRKLTDVPGEGAVTCAKWDLQLEGTTSAYFYPGEQQATGTVGGVLQLVRGEEAIQEYLEYAHAGPAEIVDDRLSFAQVLDSIPPGSSLLAECKYASKKRGILYVASPQNAARDTTATMQEMRDALKGACAKLK